TRAPPFSSAPATCRLAESPSLSATSRCLRISTCGSRARAQRCSAVKSQSATAFRHRRNNPRVAVLQEGPPRFSFARKNTPHIMRTMPLTACDAPILHVSTNLVTCRPTQAVQATVRTFIEWHLGDNLIHLHFLRRLAAANPGVRFIHAAQAGYLGQMAEMVTD